MRGRELNLAWARGHVSLRNLHMPFSCHSVTMSQMTRQTRQTDEAVIGFVTAENIQRYRNMSCQNMPLNNDSLCSFINVATILKVSYYATFSLPITTIICVFSW